MINSIIQTFVNNLIALTLVIQPVILGEKTQHASANPPSSISESASRQQQDSFSNLIEDEFGNRYNYFFQKDGFFRNQISPDLNVLETISLESNPFDSSRKVEESREEIPQVGYPEVDSNYMAEKWRTGIWGTGIGASGISALDLDNDDNTEIVVGGGYGFGDNRFWYILSYSPETGNYRQEWLSQEYSITINRITVADYNNDQLYEIYVGLSNGTIEIYNAVSRQLIGTFISSVGTMGMVVEDVDNDGEREIVVSSASGIAVYNASTYTSEWQTLAYGSTDIAVGNVDSDEASEIVTTSHVFDGISHDLEWDFPNGFGVILRLADIDNDQIEEIIASEAWYYIYAYDADIQATKWELTPTLDIQALYVGDIDNDQVQEVVYGDGQWGKIHVYDSITLTQEWSISNPQHGVTNVSFGDVDNDDSLEVLWGAGWTSTGADIFYVGNTTTHTIEWQSKDIGGPLSALDVGDIDNDGADEIVMVSFSSSSGYSDGIIFVYDAQTYALEWQSNPILNGHAWTGVQALKLADIDEDNVLEILIATADIYDGLIMAFDGISHNLEWQTTKYGGTYFSALEVADTDNDGHVEVIGGQDREHTGATGVYVRVFNGQTGVEKWKTTNLTYWGGVFDIEVGDPDNDGNPEILFSVDDGKAYIYDGVTHLQEWQSTFSYPRAVAIMDVDQDGATEFLVGNSSGTVYAYDGLSLTLEWSQVLVSGAVNSLRLADFDKDETKELVLSGANYLYIYDAITRTLIWQSPRLGTSTGNRGHLVIQDIDQDTRSEIVIGSSFAIFVFTYDLLPFDGSISVDKEFTAPGTILTYTLGLIGFSESEQPMVITDVLPINTEFITDSIRISDGAWILREDTFLWYVVLTTSEPVSLTYSVSVPLTLPHGTEILNTAEFNSNLFTDIRSASTTVDNENPIAIITHPISGQLISGDNFSISGIATDEGAGVKRVEININHTGWQTATGLSDWSFEWTLPITDSLVNIEARAIDLVGNIQTPAITQSVFVDNLAPFIIATEPVHGATDVYPRSPIVITFSEPISPETFHFLCSPNSGNWTINVSEDQKVFTLSHTPFTPNQMYSCMITQAKDYASHSLISGPTPNPWAFIVIPPIVPINELILSGQTTGLVATPITLTAEIAPISATLPITYVWQTSEQLPLTTTNGISNTTSFSWSEPGIKVITATASNPVSSIQRIITVTVADIPIAGLSATNNSPNHLGLNTVLTATLTHGTNVNYTWDFGDGQSDFGPTLSHIYPAPGVYTASVTATNSTNILTATTLITITDVPVTDLHAINTSPTTIGNITILTATISGGTNVHFTWDFGDGETGSGPVITHTYATPEIYTATVVAENSYGSISTITVVTINPPVYKIYLPLIAEIPLIQANREEKAKNLAHTNPTRFFISKRQSNKDHKNQELLLYYAHSPAPFPSQEIIVCPPKPFKLIRYKSPIAKVLAQVRQSCSSTAILLPRAFSCPNWKALSEKNIAS